MLTFHITLMWVLAAFELLLLLYVIFRYQRLPSILALAGMLFGFVVMSVGVALQIGTYDDNVRIAAGKLSFYASCIAFTSFFALAVYFPIPSVWIHRYISWLVSIPLAFFLPYIFALSKFFI